MRLSISNLSITIILAFAIALNLSVKVMANFNAIPLTDGERKTYQLYCCGIGASKVDYITMNYGFVGCLIKPQWSNYYKEYVYSSYDIEFYFISYSEANKSNVWSIQTLYREYPYNYLKYKYFQNNSTREGYATIQGMWENYKNNKINQKYLFLKDAEECGYLRIDESECSPSNFINPDDMVCEENYHGGRYRQDGRTYEYK